MTETNSDAFFGCWQGCECSATERRADLIPDRCPSHGTGLLASGDGSARVQLNHSGVSGYGFHPGGGCND